MNSSSAAPPLSFTLRARRMARRCTEIPDEIIDRPRKGFRIPLASWLRGPLRDRIGEIVASSPVFERGILDGEVFRAWNQAHQKKRADHSKPLWALFVLDHWLRRNRSTSARVDAGSATASAV